MPLKRSKRYSRKKGKGMRRYNRSKRLSSQSLVYTFKRTCALAFWNNVNNVPTRRVTFITNSNLQPNLGYFTFQLQDVNNSTDFTNLFQRYKITGVKLRFIPTRGDGADVSAPVTSGVMCPLAIAINRGATTLTAQERNFDQIMEQQDARIYSTNKPFSIYVPSPKFYAPADGLTQAQEKSGWLQNAHPEVDHYGLQFAWQFPANDQTACQFRVFATYYLKMSNPQ